jgi:diphthamide synthase (EF-2-diphthine--ammonia ligase)
MLGPLFPVWDIPTAQLGRDMIASCVKAKITCIDPSKLSESFAGRDYDLPFLQALPSDVDSCGKNGEFHTFVSDAPVFSRPIAVRRAKWSSAMDSCLRKCFPSDQWQFDFSLTFQPRRTPCWSLP